MPSFYRLENELGDGVYQMGLREIFARHVATGTVANDRHPMPWDDSKLVDNAWKQGDIVRDSKWRFGFSSIAQLRSWFYDDKLLLDLSAVGVCLSLYDVPLLDGHSQAIAEGKHLTGKNLIAIVPVAEFFKLQK